MGAIFLELYHFTSPVHLPGILKEGITKGVIPLSGLPFPKFLTGYQWLTTNPNFKQSWNEGSTLPYDRNAYRLTIKIPNFHILKIKRWTQVCHKLTPLADDLNGFGDPENWRVFKGVVRLQWIVYAIGKNGRVIPGLGK